MINQEYKQMSDDDKGIARDIEAVHSYMEDIHDRQEFENLYIMMSEEYETSGHGQIPHA